MKRDNSGKTGCEKPHRKKKKKSGTTACLKTSACSFALECAPPCLSSSPPRSTLPKCTSTSSSKLPDKELEQDEEEEEREEVAE